MLPTKRESGLVVQPMGDEKVVIDLERQDVFRLDRIAAALWERCDGHTSVQGLTVGLRQTVASDADESVVWSSLRDLSDAGLLIEPLPAEPHGISRRKLLATVALVGGAGVLAPMLHATGAAAASTDGTQAVVSGPVQPGAFMLSTNGYKALFTDIVSLGAEVEVVELREGTSLLRWLAGSKKLRSIVLKRPVTNDQGLWDWHKMADSGKAPDTFYKAATLKVMDTAGRTRAQWNIANAWPAAIELLPARTGDPAMTEQVTLAADLVERSSTLQ